jgi:hypothetical protein
MMTVPGMVLFNVIAVGFINRWRLEMASFSFSTGGDL